MDLFSVPPAAKKLTPYEVDGILERLVLASAVDPGQVSSNQPPREDSPELDLHRAILFDAVQCAVRHYSSPSSTQRAEARSALRWIESTDESYFLSFVAVCHRFGIDPSWVRRLVRREVRTAQRSWAPQAA